MRSRHWVVNASPIIVLGDIDQLPLIEQLCDELVIPQEVTDEIYAGSIEDGAQRWLQASGSSYVHHVSEVDSVVAGWDLGAGESAVLTWARQHPLFEAILDDRAARVCATTLHIPVRGTLGIVLLAKREGLLS